MKSLSTQLPGFLQALHQVSDTTCLEINFTAESLIHCIDFQFIRLLMWGKILNAIDFVNQALQKKGLSVDQALKLICELLNQLQHMRDVGVDTIMKDAGTLAQSMDLPQEFPIKRRSKKRRLDNADAPDVGFNMTT